MELKKGDIIVDHEVGVEMKVISVRKTLTKIMKDSPQASIHFQVKDNSTNQTNKCMQHMYHTNQSIHLQGGKGLGTRTTVFLVASVLEKQWEKIRDENQESIAKYNEAISNIDANKFGEELKEKKTKTRKTKYDCDLCSYKTNFFHELEVHKNLVHKSKLLVKKGKRTFYDSDSKEGNNKQSKQQNYTYDMV